MKRLAIAAFALSAAAASLVTTPAAQAGPPTTGPDGFFCGFTAATDPHPDAPSSAMTGEIDAGPATIDPNDSDMAGGAMWCRIKIGIGTHAASAAAEADFPADSNGIIAGAETVSYNRAEGAETYMCTSYKKADNTEIYWTSDDDGGRWHSDSTKACSEATSTGTQDAWDIIDGEACPEFQAEHTARDPGHTGPAATDTDYYDHEGDYFFDFDGDGISENYPAPAPQDSQHAMNDMIYDCPVYTFTIDDDDANPDRDDIFAPGVIDF